MVSARALAIQVAGCLRARLGSSKLGSLGIFKRDSLFHALTDRQGARTYSWKS